MKMALNALANFLVEAKTKTYAGNSKEVSSQRPGFKELEFRKGNWRYRDSYAGFFMTTGQEVVYFENKPFWAMAYAGGMLPQYIEKKEFASKTFCFLKKALLQVKKSRPFRGPENFKEAEWEYKDSSKGTIADFKGIEHIYYQGKEVFKQNYVGGLIKPKNEKQALKTFNKKSILPRAHQANCQIIIGK